MSKFQQREAAKHRVSGKKGFIHGVCTTEEISPRYLFLHIDGDGNSRQDWTNENLLELLPPGDLPPFPNPYATVGGSAGPGMVPGEES